MNFINSTKGQVLLKALYGAIGVFVAALLTAGQNNPALFGSYTVIVLGVCTFIEEIIPSSPSGNAPHA